MSPGRGLARPHLHDQLSSSTYTKTPHRRCGGGCSARGIGTTGALLPDMPTKSLSNNCFTTAACRRWIGCQREMGKTEENQAPAKQLEYSLLQCRVDRRVASRRGIADGSGQSSGRTTEELRAAQYHNRAALIRSMTRYSEAEDFAEYSVDELHESDFDPFGRRADRQRASLKHSG